MCGDSTQNLDDDYEDVEVYAGVEIALHVVLHAVKTGVQDEETVAVRFLLGGKNLLGAHEV